MYRKLDMSFYLREDVVTIAQELLGKYLLSEIDGVLCGGMITETEAYAGTTDRASHAYGGKRSDRTEVMYHKGGVAYVYLCYGIHSLFNIVTNMIDIPHAVLIRGIKPEIGVEEMLKRTGKVREGSDLTNGPGKLSRAMGIHFSHSGEGLRGNMIWLEDRGIKIKKGNYQVTPRIGIDYAGEDSKLPYRFFSG